MVSGSHISWSLSGTETDWSSARIFRPVAPARSSWDMAIRVWFVDSL